MKKYSLIFTFLLCSLENFAQGTLSGNLMMNNNFFQSDPTIKASGNPLYDSYLSGSEQWLNLRYNYNGFTVYARVDGFQNSNLKNPTQASTGFGLGAWGVTKDMNDLSITAGYIYEQVGSGILFRSYEDRGLLIDNALVGLHLKYKLAENIVLKAFVGQQKNNNIPQNPTNLGQRYNPIIKGLNAEGDFNIGKAHLLPGFGALNRTLDQTAMDAIAASINTLPLAQRFVPTYNMYAFTAYNTLYLGSFTWYVEGAYKTNEAIVINNILENHNGNVQYTALGYARQGLAVNLTAKRTENFAMRTSPNEILTNGMLNWQPVVARIRPGRLMSRYTPASQDLSEMAYCMDVLIAPNDNLNLTLTGTNINTLDNQSLYREGYAEAVYSKPESKWGLQGGIQYLEYNRQIYQYTRAGIPIVKAITPFVEATYRLNTIKSLRLEVEYMSTQQDYGSWVYAILEYNIAPKWSVSVSDMYNIAPNSKDDNPNYIGVGLTPSANHYYNIYCAYTKGPHRFSLAYVKQVDGINCAGGVCRYEPAFSGIKATLTSSF